MEGGEQLENPVDDFVVGNRVYVCGTKKGKIAFLGETRFSPGEWAGVVLDEPVGKNDGTVNGVRYFTCEPCRGIFCKIDKLSHCYEPMSVPSKPNIRRSASPARYSGYSSNPASTFSPGRLSGREMRNSASSGANVFTYDNQSNATDIYDENSEGSFTSYPNQAGAEQNNRQVHLEVGERVSVSNASAGVIRYIGETRFAPGYWVGVELDEPNGKNDGAVNGVRYFACRPFYGIFVLPEKLRALSEQCESLAVPIMQRGSDPQYTDPNAAVATRDAQPSVPPLNARQSGLNAANRGSRESVASAGAESSVCSSASRPGASRLRPSGVWNSKVASAATPKQYLPVLDDTAQPMSSAKPVSTNVVSKKPFVGTVQQIAAIGGTENFGVGANDVAPSGVALQKVLKEQREHIGSLQLELHGGQHELAKQTARADSLERQVSSLRDQIERLTEENTALKDRLEEQSRNVEQLKFELAEYEAMNEANMTNTCDDPESEKSQLQKELREVKQSLERSELRNEDLRRSLEEARRGWKDSRDSCAAYLDEIDRLRTDLGTRRADVGPSLAIRDDVSTADASEQPSTNVTDTSGCAQCAEMTERIAELGLRLRTTERERYEYVEKKRSLQAENADLRMRLSVTDEQLASIKARLSQSAEQQSAESQRRAEAERSRVALQAQLDEVRLRYEALLERCRMTAENETSWHASNGADHDPA